MGVCGDAVGISLRWQADKAGGGRRNGKGRAAAPVGGAAEAPWRATCPGGKAECADPSCNASFADKKTHPDPEVSQRAGA